MAGRQRHQKSFVTDETTNEPELIDGTSAEMRPDKEERSNLLEVGLAINKYATSTILTAGLVGNILTLMLMQRPFMKNSTSAIYFGTLAVGDSLRLLIDFTQIWLPKHGQKDPGNHNDITCKIQLILRSCQSRSCNIIHVIRKLHWLPVNYRVVFMVLLHVYRALNGLSPTYLNQPDVLPCNGPARVLRSADSILLTLPEAKPSWGGHVFSKAGPVLWNSLPLAVRSSPCLTFFKEKLNRFLFSKALLPLHRL